jgi:hypothetical protein
MRLISLLNSFQHFPGFVYEKARLCEESKTVEITVRPRRGSKPVCSVYSTAQTGTPSRSKPAPENAPKRHPITLQSGT